MALLLKATLRGYEYLFRDLADPETSTYFLVGSPIPVIFIASLYLIFVLDLGPEWMRNRKPYNLKNAMIIYNIIQILANMVLVYVSFFLNYDKWDLFCIRRSNPFRHVRLAGYMYYLLKLSDLTDTIFFVLRKKNNQITFLHVFHHTLMFIGVYLTLKVVPHGHHLWIGSLNSFVHVVMYSYYLLAVLDKRYSQNLTLKKSMTLFQLIQFLLISITMLCALFAQPKCDTPHVLLVFVFLQNALMLLMFGDFYYKTYIKKKKNS